MAVSVVFRSHRAAGLGSLQLGYDGWRPLTTPPDSPAIFPGVYSICANRARAAGLGSDTGIVGRLRLQGERTEAPEIDLVVSGVTFFLLFVDARAFAPVR
jgi:hypothetical protein